MRDFYDHRSCRCSFGLGLGPPKGEKRRCSDKPDVALFDLVFYSSHSLSEDGSFGPERDRGEREGERVEAALSPRVEMKLVIPLLR